MIVVTAIPRVVVRVVAHGIAILRTAWSSIPTGNPTQHPVQQGRSLRIRQSALYDPSDPLKASSNRLSQSGLGGLVDDVAGLDFYPAQTAGESVEPRVRIGCEVVVGRDGRVGARVHVGE